MDSLISLLPKLLEYGGSLAQLALVIVFVWVFKKNGNGNSNGTTKAVETLGSNHIHHLGLDIQELTKKTDGLVTGQAVQIELLRNIERNTRQ